MKRVLYLIICFSFISAYAQDFQWINGIGGTEEDFGNAIISDAENNVYITGQFRGEVDFDPGPDEVILSTGSASIYIAKYNPAGNLVWAKRMEGEGIGEALCFDQDGNILLVGTFSGTVDFDPSAGVYELTEFSGTSGFVLTLDSEGNLIWAKKIEGAEFLNDVAVDDSGNLVLVGMFYGTVDFDPGPDVEEYTAATSSDGYILKLDSEANFVWVKRIESDMSSVWINGLDVDTEGNIYSTGAYYENTDFDPGEGTHILSSLGNMDVFVLKLNGEGDFIWVSEVVGSGTNVGNSIVVDETGNTYTVGFFFNPADFQSGEGTFVISAGPALNIFAMKLDPSGGLVWAMDFGGDMADIGESIFLEDDKLYVSGRFQGTVDFDPDESEEFILTSVNENGVILMLNADGEFLHAINVEGNGDINCTDVVANGEVIYGVGYFQNRLPFQPEIPSNGLIDAFVLKFGKDYASIEESSNDIKVYPNPSRGTFFIDAPEHCTVNIYSAEGKLVYSQEKNEGNQTVSVALNPGMYFLVFSDKNQILQRSKVLIE